jgi:hypothetical protein
MLLSVFSRHSVSCKYAKDRTCRRCNSPKWIGGQVNGCYFRQSAKTLQWAEAEAYPVKLEEALAKGQPPFGPATSPDCPTVRVPRTVCPASSPLPAPGVEPPPPPAPDVRTSQRSGVKVAKAVDAWPMA